MPPLSLHTHRWGHKRGHEVKRNKRTGQGSGSINAALRFLLQHLAAQASPKVLLQHLAAKTRNTHDPHLNEAMDSNLRQWAEETQEPLRLAFCRQQKHAQQKTSHPFLANPSSRTQPSTLALALA